ncbi:MAG TPA: hypothetical protein VFE82_18275 [Ramlibacter sp.]|jgi:hypothetical protein|uniref:hypothetical protein n=1 Tax=Ramlibacter sp. TaxID=1917967 RepID=UPI002D259313|nr:hypothetical protein [Ramlibacter sp.]HZY20423.1 hypothetical protein [Ramlibacter sp.]
MASSKSSSGSSKSSGNAGSRGSRGQANSGAVTRSEAGSKGAKVSNQNSKAQSERALGNSNRSKSK